MSVNNPSPSDLDQLVTTITELWRTIKQLNFGSEEEHGKTMLQGYLLHLLKSQPLSMNDLAKTLHMSDSAATHIVDRVVKAGLVERLSSEADRRVVSIGLTESGRKRLEQIRRDRQEQLKKVFAHVPQDDIRQLIRIQQQLINALNQSNKGS